MSSHTTETAMAIAPVVAAVFVVGIMLYMQLHRTMVVERRRKQSVLRDWRTRRMRGIIARRKERMARRAHVRVCWFGADRQTENGRIGNFTYLVRATVDYLHFIKVDGHGSCIWFKQEVVQAPISCMVGECDRVCSAWWKDYLRMSKVTFTILCIKLMPHIEKQVITIKIDLQDAVAHSPRTPIPYTT